MRKKILSILLLIVMLLLLLTARITDQSEEADSMAEETSELRIAVLYEGMLGDGSYNDYCSEGASQAAVDFEIEVISVETVPEDREAKFLEACEEEYDLILCSSSAFEDILTRHWSEYPQLRFAILDTVAEGDNIQSFWFSQNQGSFLAGAAAAMFTACTDIEGINEDAVIGWVGGVDIPVLRDFFAGYEQGARYVNPDITILQSFAETWDDPQKGKELTIAQYEQGADIVMNVASGTGAGVLEAAKEVGKYAIGVDFDQDEQQMGHVLTSMIKRIDTACYQAIQSIVEGTFEGNTDVCFTVEDGGVVLTDFSVMREALGESFPAWIADEVKELEQMIISGDLVVENYEGFLERD